MKTSKAKRVLPARFKVLVGDSNDVLRQFPDNHFDALVTDPPAGIHFMGMEFDSDRGGRDQWIAWLTDVIKEVERVLKPGAHALVWALPRTSHWTAMALESGGLDIRDSIHHLFGSGMPKGLDVDKAINKSQGVKREVVAGRKGDRRKDSSVWLQGSGFNAPVIETTVAASREAKEWAGWKTSLKPSHEVWWLCRKPLSEKTVAKNVLRWGTGAINILDTGVGELGRYPTNTVLSHLTGCDKQRCAPGCVVAALNEQAGWRKSGKMRAGIPLKGGHIYGEPSGVTKETYGDEGYVSRFFPAFYCSKASQRDRGQGNDHPTVKNTALMAWMCRLVTPPGGTVLDCFMGSGSTGLACVREGFGFVGIEMDSHYAAIAQRRLNTVVSQELVLAV